MVMPSATSNERRMALFAHDRRAYAQSTRRATAMGPEMIVMANVVIIVLVVAGAVVLFRSSRRPR
jgi:hypothetical protein